MHFAFPSKKIFHFLAPAATATATLPGHPIDKMQFWRRNIEEAIC